VVGKKIIIVANSDLTFDQRLLRISRSLKSAGYQSELWGRNFLNSEPLKTEPFPQSRISLWFQKGKLAYLELNIRFFIKLISAKADAVCSVDLDTLPACWFARFFTRVKLIHDAHEYMAEVPEVYNRPVTRWIWNWIGKTMLPAVDLAYTVSQSLVDEFKKVYKKEFGLVRNIAFLNEKQEEQSPFAQESGFWVFLGAVNKGRGLEEFIPLIKQTGRKLVVMGDGDQMEEVKQLVFDLSLQSNVLFLGKVNPELTSSILSKAGAGINLLTEEGLSYRYSLANKFFDYVHAGIPQICIRFPEYENLMGLYEVGCLCTDMNSVSIIEAMNKISIPENQLRYRREAAKAREVWNWQSEEKELIRLIGTIF